MAARRRQRTPAYSPSGTDEWSTPRDLFDRLHAQHGFTLDVCATAENAKCARYFTRADNALAQTWDGVCWMNPPYDRDIGRWVSKAHDSARAGATVVCLLPAWTGRPWFHRFVLPYGEFEFLPGRLRFEGAKQLAPFDSVVVIFRKQVVNETAEA